MSHEALNPEQFAGTKREINPHQLALPGMEHLAHPWAGPIAHGYMLDMQQSPHEHHLAAVDVSHPKYPSVAAELSWARKGSGTPGEVTMVENLATGHTKEGDARARGLAGALFHSAHYWNFGQETVPIHSPERSEAGERFSNRVRPDLKPDVWANYRTEEVHAPLGKPAHEPPIWENVHYGFHPYQREELAQRAAADKKRKAKLKPKSAQGKLF
jgi:hypothetical protein